MFYSLIYDSETQSICVYRELELIQCNSYHKHESIYDLYKIASKTFYQSIINDILLDNSKDLKDVRIIK